MTTNKMTNSVAVEPVVAPKKNRRGISNSTRATTQLKFHEKDAAPNGLFLAHLRDVRVDWSINEDAKSFTGIKTPRITFEFASNHTAESEQRVVRKTLFPVESNVDTCIGGKEEWRVNNILNWVQHMLDVFYLKGRKFTEEEEDALVLDFEDTDENGQYIAVDPEVVANAYGQVFTNAAAMMNGTFAKLAKGEIAKPVYRSADGKFINCWLKLLRHIKTKKNGILQWVNVSNGDLDFAGFCGAGAVELVKGTNPPAILRIDFAKESITPKEVKKEPSIGTPALGGISGVNPIVGGGFAGPVTGSEDGNFDGSAFAAAQEGMPF